MQPKIPIQLPRKEARMKVEERDTEAGIPLLEESPASKEEGASLASAVFNIATTMIGAGIMSIPATFKAYTD